MKTIDEAAKEIYSYNVDEFTWISDEKRDAFITGVEFAQRWIPVEEPITDIWILVKNDYTYAATRISSDIDMKFIKSNFTHWRPIELK